MALQDASRRMVLLIDRSQGGANLEKGCLEMMLHHRLSSPIAQWRPSKGLIAPGKLYLYLNAVVDGATA